MNAHLHQISKIDLSCPVHPNVWDELVSTGDVLIESGLTAYIVRDNGNIARVELDYFAKAW